MESKEYGMHIRFIELAGEVNISMPYYAVDQIVLALNDHKFLKWYNIFVLGVAYKKY